MFNLIRFIPDSTWLLQVEPNHCTYDEVPWLDTIRIGSFVVDPGRQKPLKTQNGIWCEGDLRAKQ